MRFYIIRHADPDYENNTITAFGHDEARALATRMSREGLTRIYTSPLGRAQDTARYTAEATGLTPMIEEWTREIPVPAVEQGPYGRLATWDIPGEIIRANTDAVRSHEGISHLPYIQETEIAARSQYIREQADLFFERLGYRREGELYRCIAPHYERIALFCHGGFGQVLISHLLGIPLPLIWSGIWLAPSSVTTVLMEQRSETWAVPRCVAIGDTGHLYAAGLPVRPRGILALNWMPPHE